MIYKLTTYSHSVHLDDSMQLIWIPGSAGQGFITMDTLYEWKTVYILIICLHAANLNLHFLKRIKSADLRGKQTVFELYLIPKQICLP